MQNNYSNEKRADEIISINLSNVKSVELSVCSWQFFFSPVDDYKGINGTKRALIRCQHALYMIHVHVIRAHGCYIYIYAAIWHRIRRHVIASRVSNFNWSRQDDVYEKKVYTLRSVHTILHEAKRIWQRRGNFARVSHIDLSDDNLRCTWHGIFLK